LGVFTASFAKNHKHSKLGVAFKALVEIADGDDELNKVSVILNEVEAELQADYDALSAQYEQITKDFNDAHAAVEEWRSAADAELVEADHQIAGLNTVISELEEAIKISLDAINNAESQIDALNAQREADHAAFSDRSAALEKAIKAAQEALQLVIEISEKDLGASFIEINNKKITKHFHAISHKLNKKNMGQLSTTMAQLLADATADGINAEVAGQLVDLIERLIETLSSELDGAVAMENEQVAQTDAAVAGYNDVIANESASATSNQGSLDIAEVNLGDWNAHVADIIYWYNYVDGAWESYRIAYYEQSANYDALLERLRRDIHALNVAEDILVGN